MNTKFDNLVNEMMESGSEEMEIIKQIRQSLTLNASRLENLKVKAMQSNENGMSASLSKVLRLVDDARRELFELQK
jgi:hypothetical protein